MLWAGDLLQHVESVKIVVQDINQSVVERQGCNVIIVMFVVTDTPGKEQEAKDTKVRKEGHGAFYMLPHYMKLYDMLKGAYANYKVCRRCICM